MIRAFLRRLLDTYRHYGEYPTQRQYRRYLEGIDQAQKVTREPYKLTSVRLVPNAETRARLVPGPTEVDWSGFVQANRLPMAGDERDFPADMTFEQATKPCAEFDPISDDSDLCNTCGHVWADHPAEQPDDEYRAEDDPRHTPEIYDEWSRLGKEGDA